MSKRTLCVCTGASRGFGAALVREYARRSVAACRNTDFVLVARQLAGLKETAASVTSILQQESGKGLETRDPVLVTANLVEMAEVRRVCSFLDDNVHWGEYEHVLYFCNAGMLGASHSRALGAQDGAMVQDAVSLNVSTGIQLASYFVHKHHEAKVPKTTLLNVSSLAAIKEFPSWGVYCACKAARLMFYKAIAEEEKDSGIRVLSYSPGPLDTDMQREIRESKSIDEDMQRTFCTMHADGALVSPDVSARAGIELVEQDEFTNGEQIDYYDVAGGGRK